MLEVTFHDMSSTTDHLIYAILVSRYHDKWVVVRHEERDTWEVPGGHIETGETPDEAAARELIEETGAVDFSVRAITDYSVTRDEQPPGYGRLYFCEVTEIGPLGDSEIAEVALVDELPDNLTYKDIQPKLLEKVRSVIERA